MQAGIARRTGILAAAFALGTMLAASGPGWSQSNVSPPADLLPTPAGNPVGRSTSTSVLQLLATRGSREAQLMLGTAYSRGEGVPQDDEQAVLWWRKAAEQGSADAQNELGSAYAEGRGVPIDPARAVEWWRKAADQDLAVAQANLGNMYRDGVGVTKNEKHAVELYRKAADHDLGWGQLYLADSYATGRGVTKDPRQAVQWYRKAALQDYVEAQYKLGAMYRYYRKVVAKRGDRSREAYGEYWLTRAAMVGHETAIRDLQAMIGFGESRKLPAAVAVREQPDVDAPVIRYAEAGEKAYVLPDPDGTRRVKGWLAVYLVRGYTMGFIDEGQLR
jgi:TPR repeat protein